MIVLFFFFSSRRRHTRCLSDWSSDVCSSDLEVRRILPSCFFSQRLRVSAVSIRISLWSRIHPLTRGHPGREDFGVLQPNQHPLHHLFLLRFLLCWGARVAGQEAGAIFGGDHLAAGVAGARTVVGGDGCGVDGQHLAERLLQFLESVLADAGIGLLEGQVRGAPKAARKWPTKSKSIFMPMRRRFSKTAAMRGRSSASLPSFSTREARVTTSCTGRVVWRPCQASRNLPVMMRQSLSGVVWRLRR